MVSSVSPADSDNGDILEATPLNMAATFPDSIPIPANIRNKAIVLCCRTIHHIYQQTKTFNDDLEKFLPLGVGSLLPLLC